MTEHEMTKDELLEELRATRSRVEELEDAAQRKSTPGEAENPWQVGRPAENGDPDPAETRDFLRGILNSSTLVSIVLTDPDQNVLFWNTGAQNMFGYSSEEMLGSKVTRLYPSDSLTKETVEALRTMVRQKSGAVHGKMKQLSKAGDALTISLALSPMLDTSGEVKGILGVGLDVTEEERQKHEILRLFDQVRKTQDAAIFALAKLAESRDEETGAHLIRIQDYTRVLCEQLSEKEDFRNILTPQYIEDLVRSAVLHDIGKVSIPDSILLSPEGFSPEDHRIMMKHTIVGGKALEEAAERLGESSFLTLGMEVAYYHHERWDGSGYPFGLAGEAIPLSARIVSVADVYDALTTERRYKKAFSHESACAMIGEGKNAQFDPRLVDALMEAEKEFRTVRDTVSV
jgi:PAS domain S-box-containing protein